MPISNFIDGWLESKVSDAVTQLNKSPFHYQSLPIQGNPPPEKGRIALYDLSRKVLGKDVDNVIQLIGDCVGVSSEHCCEYVQFASILNGTLDEFKYIFPPYNYGISRCQIGNEWGSYQDGSVAAWTAAGVVQFGCVTKDANGVPAYTASVARDYGAKGPPQSMIDMGKIHLIKSTAAIKTKDDLIASLWNGYPVQMASSIGYSMTADSPTGFMIQNATWNHSMTVIAVTYGMPGIPDHGIILNNWGDCHGQLVDLVDNTIQLPVGVIRAHLDDIMKAISAGDTFAYSDLDGFPAKPLDPSFFNLWS
jgi:hypothetical protein